MSRYTITVAYGEPSTTGPASPLGFVPQSTWGPYEIGDQADPSLVAWCLSMSLAPTVNTVWLNRAAASSWPQERPAWYPPQLPWPPPFAPPFAGDSVRTFVRGSQVYNAPSGWPSDVP